MLYRSVVWAFFLSVGAHAAVVTDPVTSPPPSASSEISEAPEEIKFAEQEQRTRLVALDAKINEVHADIRAKTKTLHALQNGAAGVSYLWQDEPDTVEQRRKLQKLLQIAIRSRLHDLEALEAQRGEMTAELDWISMRLQKEAEISAGAKKIAHFRCSLFPVTASEGHKLSLVQDFGTRRDQDTGIAWKSLGWWISQVGSEVRSCGSGIVAFSDKVAGRGRVLIIDHGAGNMTLYANLNDDPQLVLKKGTKVTAGMVLGTPKDKVYFEVRERGVAVNPRLVMSSDGLAKSGL